MDNDGNIYDLNGNFVATMGNEDSEDNGTPQRGDSNSLLQQSPGDAMMGAGLTSPPSEQR